MIGRRFHAGRLRGSKTATNMFTVGITVGEVFMSKFGRYLVTGACVAGCALSGVGMAYAAVNADDGVSVEQEHAGFKENGFSDVFVYGDTFYGVSPGGVSVKEGVRGELSEPGNVVGGLTWDEVGIFVEDDARTPYEVYLNRITNGKYNRDVTSKWNTERLKDEYKKFVQDNFEKTPPVRVDKTSVLHALRFAE